MTFAEKLYLLRTQRGYSQEVLAEKLSVSRQAISKWELGTVLPDTDKIIALSDLFSVSTDSLLIDSINLNTHDSMERVVLKFLNSAQEMEEISKQLIDITCDGVIDETERERMNEIINTLDSVTKIIEEIKRKMDVYE
ncbi:MAG: helix-turn-helix transcriptional regulator [Lachnospira sp.]|nr:helix-turn-helix transcriptional regulator [Lachnospira sp.]